MIIDRVVTKVAMEAKAAISRRSSVIVVSRVRYVFTLFSFRAGVNNRTKWKRIFRHIPATTVNGMLTRPGGQTPPLAILGIFNFGRDTSGASN
jgi:hypothetical protein